MKKKKFKFDNLFAIDFLERVEKSEKLTLEEKKRAINSLMILVRKESMWKAAGFDLLATKDVSLSGAFSWNCGPIHFDYWDNLNDVLYDGKFV